MEEEGEQTIEHDRSLINKALAEREKEIWEAIRLYVMIRFNMEMYNDPLKNLILKHTER